MLHKKKNIQDCEYSIFFIFLFCMIQPITVPFVDMGHFSDEKVLALVDHAGPMRVGRHAIDDFMRTS